MRRRSLGALAASIALISLIGGVTFASASRNTAPQKLWSRASSAATAGRVATATVAGHGQTLVVVSRNETETEIDNAPRGEFSQGDEDVVTSPLYRAGRKVGRLDVHVVFTEVDLEAGLVAFQVTFTSTLRGGQITSTGVGTFSEEGAPGFEAAVTGGTGAYSRARGEVHATFGERSVRFVYHLTR